MAWNEHRVITHGPQTIGDAGNQLRMIATGKICAAYASGKQHITHEGPLGIR